MKWSKLEIKSTLFVTFALANSYNLINTYLSCQGLDKD
jgi:hypothetical protein